MPQNIEQTFTDRRVSRHDTRRPPPSRRSVDMRADDPTMPGCRILPPLAPSRRHPVIATVIQFNIHSLTFQNN